MMAKEEKQLLLKDLAARLPYGVKFGTTDIKGIWTLNAITSFIENKEKVYLCNITNRIDAVRPYLRPLSSMTEEETKELASLIRESWEFYDYFNAHHFDYRGLIEKGLALEAPADMYK